MKIISLSQGYEAQVDDADHEELSQRTWYVLRTQGGKRCYARTRINRKDFLSMQAYLMNPAPGMEVDHIDGNPLNNQRANLRCVTRGRNCLNRIVKNSHGYPGVYRNNKNYWSAYLTVNRRKMYLGNFSNVEGAAIAYREAYLAALGEDHPFYRTVTLQRS